MRSAFAQIVHNCLRILLLDIDDESSSEENSHSIYIVKRFFESALVPLMEKDLRTFFKRSSQFFKLLLDFSKLGYVQRLLLVESGVFDGALSFFVGLRPLPLASRPDVANLLGFLSIMARSTETAATAHPSPNPFATAQTMQDDPGFFELPALLITPALFDYVYESRNLVYDLVPNYPNHPDALALLQYFMFENVEFSQEVVVLLRRWRLDGWG